MKINILTIFPEAVLAYAKVGVLGRAQKNGPIKIQIVDIRDFSQNKHRTVDDTPYGGGPGMVMKPEPIYSALKNLNAIPFKQSTAMEKLKTVFSGEIRKKKKTILLSPRGKQFDGDIAKKMSKYDEITFICGRYEGVDERVSQHMIDEEISIGPYVLAGGELGALVVVEALARFIPGVLGNEESLKEETKYILNKKENEYPQYTKPVNFLGWKVPSVLLNGDHKKIEEWRKDHRENPRKAG